MIEIAYDSGIVPSIGLLSLLNFCISIATRKVYFCDRSFKHIWANYDQGYGSFAFHDIVFFLPYGTVLYP